MRVDDVSLNTVELFAPALRTRLSRALKYAPSSRLNATSALSKESCWR
jgi:hypothetical protein